MPNQTGVGKQSMFSYLFHKMLLSDPYNERILKSDISLMKSILNRFEEQNGQDIATRETISELRTLKAQLVNLRRQRMRDIVNFKCHGFILVSLKEDYNALTN